MNNNLHAEIMNLPVKVDWPEDTDSVEIWGYKVGHRDARHAAAELAIKQDALINDLLEDLHCRWVQTKCGCGHPACNRCEDDRNTEAILDKVYDFVKAKGETNYERT